MTYLNHIVIRGDTIQRIAQQYNIADWRDIVTLNNLCYPYIISEAVYNTLTPLSSTRGVVKIIGQTLLIPSTNLLQAAENVNKEILEEAAYGLDLDLFSTLRTPEKQPTYKTVYGEFNSESNDLRISRGINNLYQAVLTRLSTPFGTLELHPNYGSGLMALIGEKRTDNNIIKMRLEIERSILSDSRVSKVEALRIIPNESRAIHIDCKVYPVDPILAFQFSETITQNGIEVESFA